MRPEFRDIVSGWTLYSGTGDLDERLERLAAWTVKHRPLEADEDATVKMMVEAQIMRKLADDPSPLMREAAARLWPGDEFRLLLNLPTPLANDVFDRLYEACDGDGTVTIRGEGVALMTFDCTPATRDREIAAVIARLKAAGFDATLCKP